MVMNKYSVGHSVKKTARYIALILHSELIYNALKQCVADVPDRGISSNTFICFNLFLK